MPLPAPNETWPPKHLERVYCDLARWSAWFSGDPDELSRVYGGDYRPLGRGWEHDNGSWSARGGLVGALNRWFWGERVSPGEKRTKLHVPLAAEIAQVSADLLFGQPPSFLAKKDETAQERLDDLLSDRSQAQLHEAAETCAALGHVYLRVGWDRDVDPTGPLLSVVDADAAYPVYRFGHLMEVTFCREWCYDGVVLRHLELHEPGMIWHAAYLGDYRNLGRLVPLSSHPETADLADQEMIADETRAGSGIPTGIDVLDVVGVANARSRTWRHIPAAQDLGRADISGVEADLDALDDTFSSWMRDVRHGRSRIHVPGHMLEDHGRGNGATANLDRELYVGLNSPPDGDLQLQATQFNIRHVEHAETARGLMERIVAGAGYSLQTFGMERSTTTMTATESWAQQVRSQHTRNGKLRRWNEALLQLTKILLLVDQAQFGGKASPDAEIEVQFADTVSESQMVRAQTVQILRAADAASTRTVVEMFHNDRDGEWIDEEVQRIEAGNDSGEMPDLTAMPADGMNPSDPGAQPAPQVNGSNGRT
jgi:SPP1 Gp6-like portal protein